jgi:hypothetical protein
VFWSTVGRLVIVPVGILLAGIATGFVLLTLGLERLTAVLHERGTDGDVAVAFEVLDQGMLLTTGFTIIPALLLVIVGEIARIRSSLYYIVGGGAALAAMPLLARVGQSGGFVFPDETVLQVFAAAGFAGGFVYWLVAGRTA